MSSQLLHLHDETIGKGIPGAKAGRALCFVLGSLLVVLFALRVVPEYWTSSDAYFFPRLAKDLLEDGGRLADWVLISAPRFFPDMGIYFLSHLLYGDHLRVMQMAAYMLILLQLSAVSLLCHRVSDDWRASLVAGLAYVGTCSVLGNDKTSLALVAWHSGTFAVILICVYLLVGEKSFWLRALTCAGLIILLVLSNFLAVPILLSGVAGWWVALSIARRRVSRQSVIQTVAVVGACGIGMALYYALVPNSFNNPVHASGLSVEAVKDIPFVLESIKLSIMALGSNVLFLSALLLSLPALYVVRLQRDRFDILLAMVGFWLASALANEFLIALGASNVDRYRMMPINGSIAMAAIASTLILSQFRGIHWAPLFILTPAVALGTTPADAARSRLFNRTVAEVNCLSEKVSETNGTWGVSDLQTAHRYSVLSNGELNLLPSRGNKLSAPPAMFSRGWLTNTFYYVIAERRHSPASYATKKWAYPLSRRLAISMLGNPNEEHLCGTKVLMVYQKEISVNR